MTSTDRGEVLERIDDAVRSGADERVQLCLDDAQDYLERLAVDYMEMRRQRNDTRKQLEEAWKTGWSLERELKEFAELAGRLSAVDCHRCGVETGEVSCLFNDRCTREVVSGCCRCLCGGEGAA